MAKWPASAFIRFPNCFGISRSIFNVVRDLTANPIKPCPTKITTSEVKEIK